MAAVLRSTISCISSSQVDAPAASWTISRRAPSSAVSGALESVVSVALTPEGCTIAQRGAQGSEPGDGHLVDNLVDADHVADDPQDLIQHVYRLDLTRHPDPRPGDGNPDPIAGRDVGRTQGGDHVGLQLVIAGEGPVLGLDGVVALQLAGIGLIGAGNIDAGLRLPRLADDAVGGRHVRNALLAGNQVVVRLAARRLLDQVAGILR